MLLPFHRREYGLQRSKSWSCFTSYHLRMSPKLPLVLWTVSTVVLVKRKALHRHYRGLPKHGFFSHARVHEFKGVAGIVSFSDSITSTRIVRTRKGPGGRTGWNENLVDSFRWRLEEKTLDRVKGFSCGIRITTGSGIESLEGLQGIATVSLIRIRAKKFIFRWCKHGDVFKD